MHRAPARRTHRGLLLVFSFRARPRDTAGRRDSEQHVSHHTHKPVGGSASEDIVWIEPGTQMSYGLSVWERPFRWRHPIADFGRDTLSSNTTTPDEVLQQPLGFEAAAISRGTPTTVVFATVEMCRKNEPPPRAGRRRVFLRILRLKFEINMTKKINYVNRIVLLYRTHPHTNTLQYYSTV